jgi:hypothetical protein
MVHGPRVVRERISVARHYRQGQRDFNLSYLIYVTLCYFLFIHK